MNNENFLGLGIFLTHNFDKTAAEKASDDLWLDAYCAGLESGLGIEEGTGNISKVANQLTGRAIMGDFMSRLLLEK